MHHALKQITLKSGETIQCSRLDVIQIEDGVPYVKPTINALTWLSEASLDHGPLVQRCESLSAANSIAAQYKCSIEYRFGLINTPVISSHETYNGGIFWRVAVSLSHLGEKIFECTSKGLVCEVLSLSVNQEETEKFWADTLGAVVLGSQEYDIFNNVKDYISKKIVDAMTIKKLRSRQKSSYSLDGTTMVETYFYDDEILNGLVEGTQTV